MAGAGDFNFREMISFLRGTVVELLPMRLIIEAGGVGYDVHIPLSTYDKLPVVGSETKILTHLQVREDAHILYGFATPEERDLFLLLLNNVSGVGPKLALAILNGSAPVQFRGLVVAGDIAALSRIKGVGKKTAERIIVELRDKVGVSAAWEAASAQQGLSPDEQQVNDAVLALISLGFKQAEAHKVVRGIHEKEPKASVEELIKEALRVL
jgi:Holliday junction DNA helicase RuvA